VDDEALLERLLSGDRDAFRDLVRRYQVPLVRVARYYVRTEASAEDVAQETWVAVMKGLERFEGRSTFKTWLFRICANRARTIGAREHRVVSLDPTHPVARERFDEGGMWSEAPEPFDDLLGDRLANAEVVELVRRCIEDLPEPQQSVVTLRDVEGLSTSEVAAILELSDANTRVILHRGRARIREVLEVRRKEGLEWR
jgi:RNA polymerase sigma-70 factor, ECF subfamily